MLPTALRRPRAHLIGDQEERLHKGVACKRIAWRWLGRGTFLWCQHEALFVAWLRCTPVQVYHAITAIFSDTPLRRDCLAQVLPPQE